VTQLRKLTLKGKILSGEGKGSYFVTLPWAMKQLKKKLEFTPFPGTLNLQITSKTALEGLRDSTKGIKIEPPKGFHSGRCFKAVLLGEVQGAVVLPDVPSYPSDVLEILAPINLREKFNLKDGMELSVTIWLE